MKKIVFIFLALIGISPVLCAQYITVAQYVDQYKDIAVREMKRMGVPAAISLAQGILETENGNSDLVKKSNNHFGIKCKSSWTSASVAHDDDAPGECFRVYKDADESYRDHSNFLRGNSRYAFLFKLDPRDYKAWAYGLRKAGYATNPRYPEILIKNIEDNNLQQYTMEAIGNVPVFDASKYTSDPEDKEIQPTVTDSVKEDNLTLTEPAKLSINGSRALYVSKGTSLLAVATQNNINLAKLLEINDLEKDGLLEKDQFIFLDKKQKTGDRNYYIVQQNETLYDVAQKNGVQLQSLYEYNSLSAADTIYAGTKILLRPGQAAAIAQSVASKNSNLTGAGSSTFHIVEAGENLYSISRKYNVTVDELKEWNNLKDNMISAGRRIIISK